MRNKGNQGYRNPAYIYDEGQSGGGPDTRSSASTSSSRSSMKVIGSKLKVQGRRWYIWLALIILVIIIIIVAVTTTLVLKNNNGDGASSASVLLNVSRTENLSTTTGKTSAATTETKEVTQAKTTQTTTTTSTTTTTPSTTKTTTTKATTRTTAATTEAKTEKTTEAATPKATSKTTTTTTTTKATTEAKTTTRTTASSTVPSTTKQVDTTTPSSATTTTKTTTATTNGTTHHVTTKDPDENSTTQTTSLPTTSVTTESTSVTNGNLTVSLSSILYYPGDVKSVTLRCNGRHTGDWKTMTIRRQFKDSYEPVAVAVLKDFNDVEVVKLYPNVSHTIGIGEYDVALSIVFDPFLCQELTNFTCAFANEYESVTGRAHISIYMPPPQITLPHSIVEGSELTLNCVAEVWGSSASVVWQFKPEYASNFMKFSVEPVTNITYKDCASHINSTLVFNPTMYEDGAEFKCEITDTYVHPQVIQTVSDEVTFKVVPSNYCEGKRQFTIHPHPHGPCTLVVYCLDTGPLVYEIECEQGQCYDYVKTACVPS